MGDFHALEPLISVPNRGRTFGGERKVRLGDVTPTGRLRLDALTRYTQDVSDDDTTDAGLATEPGWVVRRTEVDVVRTAALAETLSFTTFCSGLGRRWAERRLSITGDEGAHYEVATLWICVDPVSGRPASLTDQFRTIYGEAAGDRAVNARLVNPKPPAAAADHEQVWPLRAVDFDTLGHVNNAAYWAVIEELDADGRMTKPPFRARLEYSAGLTRHDQVTIVSNEVFSCWWLVGHERSVVASANVGRLSPSLYEATVGGT